jgi:tRNA(Ile)-lysidine synthase
MVSVPLRRRSSADIPDDELRARVAAVLSAAGLRGGRLVLGLSGGLDSMVLLDLLVGLRAQLRFELAALHVNHQLSPHAAEWSAFCARRCAHYGVAFREAQVTVQRGSGEGLEAAARAARYAVFREQDADAIVLAHHLDDQAETVLLQLLRGAGPRGLAAMPAARPLERAHGPQLVRPLLEVERARITTYARRHRLSWVEDESNLDPSRDRNFLRHEVLPHIARRFPGYRQAWLRASRNFADLSEIADAQAQADATGAVEPGGLRVARLRELSPARAANLLRWYLVREGLPHPPRDQLEELLRQLGSARADAHPAMQLAGARLYRHRGLLKIAPRALQAVRPWRVVWHGEPDLALPQGLGRLHFERVAGSGLSAQRLAGLQLSVRSRVGGERIRLDVNRPTRTLKNLLRESQVPPWQRDRLPLLASDRAVLWVAGLGVDCRFAARPGEPGILPRWLPSQKESG